MENREEKPMGATPSGDQPCREENESEPSKEAAPIDDEISRGRENPEHDRLAAETAQPLQLQPRPAVSGEASPKFNHGYGRSAARVCASSQLSMGIVSVFSHIVILGIVFSHRNKWRQYGNSLLLAN